MLADESDWLICLGREILFFVIQLVSVMGNPT
jgi:hypothetical protein